MRSYAMEDYGKELLSTMESWITVTSALLYVKMVYGLALTPNELWMLGGKFGFMKDTAGTPLVHAETLDRTVARCYFPDIPSGYSTVSSLAKKYPKIGFKGINDYIKAKKVAHRMVEIGTEEILLVEEKGIARLYKDRQHAREAKRRESEERRRQRDPFWSATPRKEAGRKRVRRGADESKRKAWSPAGEHKRSLDRLIRELEEDGVDTQWIRPH